MTDAVTLEQSTMFILWLAGFFSFPALVILVLLWYRFLDWVQEKARRREVAHFDKVLAEGTGAEDE